MYQRKKPEQQCRNGEDDRERCGVAKRLVPNEPNDAGQRDRDDANPEGRAHREHGEICIGAHASRDQCRQASTQQ
jgi:hypothetical protein